MPRVVAEKGPDRGSTWSIRERGVLLIGRDSAAQIALRDDEISRRHCQIEFRDGHWIVRDLDSTNGVQVNGEWIEEPTRLNHNDHIDVGITRLTFLKDDDPLLGIEIGGCRIEKRIGRGGMGTVYRARQKSLDRPVALKILSEKYTSDPQFIQLFIREARAAGRLSHPHIVQVYDVGKEENYHYFTMELVAGGSVEKLIDEEGCIGLESAIRFARDAARGLEYAEKQGVVHRDIKPGNLMISSSGVVKIGDLGIARTTDESGVASQKDGVSGSPHYIAPEQARGDAIDQRADIYSLGATLYHCLAGRTPYRGAGAREIILKHIHATEPPDLTEVSPETPEDVCQLVARMMSPQPESRPTNARVLGVELDQLLERYRGINDTVPRTELRSSLSRIVIPVVMVAAAVVMWSQWNKHETEDRIARELQDSRHREITRNLDLAESAISRGEPVSADEILQSLVEVPEQFTVRIEDLERRIELEQQRIDSLAREDRARNLLADILAASEEQQPLEQKLERLQQLGSDHSETRAGSRALELAVELRAQLVARNQLEDRASNLWSQTLARAQGWRTSGNPARAREEALAFSEEFSKTDAWQQRSRFLVELSEDATGIWEAARQEVSTLLTRGHLAQAEDVIDGVVSRALLPATREREPELRELVRVARQEQQAVLAPEVGPVLREGWSRWSRTFSGREAMNTLRDAALRDGLPEAALQVTDRHLDFLMKFDPLLAKLETIELPRRKERIIEGSSSGEIPAIHVTIEKDRVIYRESKEQVGRYLLWKEIAPGSRLDLLLEAGPPALLLEPLILLLEWSGRPQEAIPLWKQLPETSRTRLRQMIEELGEEG